jgi:hypothetical protein
VELDKTTTLDVLLELTAVVELAVEIMTVVELLDVTTMVDPELDIDVICKVGETLGAVLEMTELVVLVEKVTVLLSKPALTW